MHNKTMNHRRSSLTEKEVSIIIKNLSSVHPVLIYCFGSKANDKMHNDSDIDIAFLSNKKISSYENFQLSEKLASHLSKDVDLIPLLSASVVLKCQVIKSGKLIYCKSEKAKNEFEMYALSDYARLNEERRPIIERVLHDGTVYGY